MFSEGTDPDVLGGDEKKRAYKRRFEKCIKKPGRVKLGRAYFEIRDLIIRVNDRAWISFN